MAKKVSPSALLRSIYGKIESHSGLSQPLTLILLLSCNRGSMKPQNFFLVSMEAIACLIWCLILIDLAEWAQKVRHFVVPKSAYLIVIC